MTLAALRSQPRPPDVCNSMRSVPQCTPLEGLASGLRALLCILFQRCTRRILKQRDGATIQTIGVISGNSSR